MSEANGDMIASEYVMTRDMEKALVVLKEKGRVVLCGPPGCGKTTLAHALLSWCQKQGFSPFVLTSVEQWHEHIGEKKKCVVLMDGIFGTVRMNQAQHESWRAILPSLLELARKGDCRLILTVYPHVLRELIIFDARTVSPFVDGLSIVQVMQDPLDNDVRTSVINFHLKELNLEPETQSAVVERILHKDISGPVFPWCCHQMCLNWQSSADPTHTFDTPAEAYVPLLQQMLLSSACEDTVAAVLALTMLGLGEFLLNPLRVQSDLFRLGFHVFSDDRLEKCAYFLKGSVLAKSGGEFSSRILYEAAGLALGRCFYLPVLLKVCDQHFLVKYVRTTDTATDSSISVDSERRLLELFLRRLHQEIMQGHLPVISQHPCLQCFGFLDILKDLGRTEQTFLKRMMKDDQESVRHLLTTVDSDHGLPLLYWSTLSRTPILTKWCLTVTKNRKFLTCLPRVLLALALFHQQPDRYQQVFSLVKDMNINVSKIFTFSTNTVLLPLPKPHDRIVKEISEVCQLLSDYEHNGQQLCYLNSPSLPIPASVVSVQMTEKGVSVQVADRQHWYLVLRLLTDSKVDQVDEQGHTLLRQAFEAEVLEILGIVLKGQLMQHFPHFTGFLKTLTAIIQHLCLGKTLPAKIFRLIMLKVLESEVVKKRLTGNNTS